MRGDTTGLVFGRWKVRIRENAKPSCSRAGTAFVRSARRKMPLRNEPGAVSVTGPGKKKGVGMEATPPRVRRDGTARGRSEGGGA
jgi:hypothetical protein